MKKKIFLLIAVTLVFFANRVWAVDYYVTTVGDEYNDGLSWTTPTTLHNALTLAQTDDVIHIGSGTYKPTQMVTGGNSDFDATFEIKKNITLIGGYPVSPTAGDRPDAANKTILDGTLAEGQHAYHVVVITAPVETDKQVNFTNIAITGGKAAEKSIPAITINGSSYVRVNGSAMIIAKSNVVLNSCEIHDNTSEYHTPGIYTFQNAILTLNNCVLRNNVGNGNGASLWATASTIYANNTLFTGNTCTGVGAIQLISHAKAFFYNCTIVDNEVLGTETWRNGGGIYVRDGSELRLVNSTIYGNKAGGNAGIALHTSKPETLPVKAILINSTIAQNTTTAPATAGVAALTAGATIEIYNSIIAGNINKEGSSKNPDLDTSIGDISKKQAIISDKVYDADGIEVAERTFNPITMLDVLADNGGATPTCKLLLSDAENPARSLGMSASELIALGASYTPGIPNNVILRNQMGNLRTHMIGAWTTTAPTTSLKELAPDQPNVFTRDGCLFVAAEVSTSIAVYSVLGKLLTSTVADVGITRISNLPRGHVYIVTVNDRRMKIAL